MTEGRKPMAQGTSTLGATTARAFDWWNSSGISLGRVLIGLDWDTLHTTGYPTPMMGAEKRLRVPRRARRRSPLARLVLAACAIGVASMSGVGPMHAFASAESEEAGRYPSLDEDTAESPAMPKELQLKGQTGSSQRDLAQGGRKLAKKKGANNKKRNATLDCTYH